MPMTKAKVWRRSGYALCVLGVILLLADEFLPVDLFVSRQAHVYYRVVPGMAPEWYWWCGGVLFVMGIAAIVVSTRYKRDGGDAI